MPIQHTAKRRSHNYLHVKAGEQAASDVEGDVTAILVALYAGAHATLPTDATAQLPPRHHREG